MYNSIKRISFPRGLANDGVVFPPVTWNWYQLLRKSSGLVEKKAEATGEVIEEMSFTSFVQQRQEQARRSVIVQINQQKNWIKLVSFCSSFGKISKIFHYHQNKPHFVLIEMNSEEELKYLLKCTQGLHFKTSDQFLVLNNNFDNGKVKRHLGVDIKFDLNGATSVNTNTVLSRDPGLVNPTMTELINFYYNVMKVNDLGLRLRFLMCRQLERLFAALIPNLSVFPFGSSITGFGINGCDLDVVMLSEEHKEDNLFTLEKNFSITDRFVMQQHLGLVSDVMRTFMTGCKGVIFIRNAKVPIVKFRSDFTLLDCDLSLYNTHGISMSQMLHIFAALDERVKPFVFILKLWSSSVGLVSKNPGPTITNFNLSLLAIFFLQQCHTNNGPVLPPWNIFPKAKNFLLTDEEVMSGTKEFKKKFDMNSLTLEELLVSFFKYYSVFDFKRHGVSINTGTIFENVNKYPMHIENPISPELNASKNVSYLETKKFQELALLAMNILDLGKSVDSSLKTLRKFLQSENYKSKNVLNNSLKKNSVNLSKLLGVKE